MSFNVNQLMQKTVSIESRFKESRDAYKSHRQNVHFVGDCSDDSDDDNNEFFFAEIKRPTENKLLLVLLSSRFIKIGMRK